MNEDEWIKSDYNISLPPQRSAVEEELQRGPVIIEHWFYYGSRPPDRVIVENMDDFDAYLAANAKPGDVVHVWSFADLCRNDNAIAEGEVPDEQGRVPRRGAY